MGRIFMVALACCAVAMTAHASDLVLQESGNDIVLLDFGDVDQGSSETRFIEIRNNSASPLVLLDITNVFVAGPLANGQGGVSLDIIGSTMLTPGQTLSVAVHFAPQRPGKFRGSLIVQGSLMDLLTGSEILVEELLDIRGQDLPGQ